MDTLIPDPTTPPPAAATGGADAKILLTMLRNHYQPPNRGAAGIFATEIQAPDSTRRADALWMPTTIAGGRGNGLVGHEVKVTRADLRAELEDPTKAEAWARFCSRWWLVIPHAGLLSGLTVPDLWGVMTPPSGRRSRQMTVVKPAPVLTPTDPAPAYERIAAWLLYDAAARVGAAERAEQRAAQEVVALQRRVAALEAGRSLVSDAQTRKVDAILSGIRDRAGPGRGWLAVPTELIVDAAVDAAATAQAAERVRLRLESTIRTVTDVLEPFQSVVKDLAAAHRMATQLPDPDTAAAIAAVTAGFEQATVE